MRERRENERKSQSGSLKLSDYSPAQMPATVEGEHAFLGEESLQIARQLRSQQKYRENHGLRALTRSLAHLAFSHPWACQPTE